MSFFYHFLCCFSHFVCGHCFALVCYFMHWGYCIVLMLLLPIVVILWCFYFVLLRCGAIASHCCCFMVLLQLCVGVVAPHWWYCFIMVLQICIGAITPCYYFALMFLLFPWLKWSSPLALCKWELGSHSTKLLTKFNMNFFSFFIWGLLHFFVSIFFIVLLSCFFWFWFLFFL